MAAICNLGAALAYRFSGQDLSQCVQQVLAHFYSLEPYKQAIQDLSQSLQQASVELSSWEAFAQGIQDFSSLSTVLTVGASGFVYKYFLNSRKAKNLQQELNDFPFENINTR